jgi:putative colanic acid biosynthesis acetyltransferase WcaF
MARAAPTSNVNITTFLGRLTYAARLIFWMFPGRQLFAWTFHNWYGLRRAMLRAFGARLGHSVIVRPSAIITRPWNLIMHDHATLGDKSRVHCEVPVQIGARSTISQYAVLDTATRDVTMRGLPLVLRPVVIGDDCWIAADVYIGPGARVGDGAIVGSRATVFESVAPWTIVGGDPLRVLGKRDKPTP